MKKSEQISVVYEDNLTSPNVPFLRDVIAFANTRGGSIAVTIKDKDGSAIGIPSNSLFQTLNTIEQCIMDSCEPTIIADFEVQDIEGRNIILVRVPKGMQKPYYIKSEGMLNGVYIQIGGKTRPAPRHLVKELILQGQGRHYDQEIVENRIVSEEIVDTLCTDMYTVAKENANGKSVKLLTKEQLISWNLLSEQNGLLTPSQGFLLLSGASSVQTDVQIQCAVFKGTTQATFLNRRDVSGPLYRQVQDAYTFVMQHIELRSHFEGIYRKDYYELPGEAIRELIANAVCHRSYLVPEKIQVALYDNRLEITSPEMLYDDLTIEEMKRGISRPRNRAIANAFVYMGIIESWGSGIPRLFELTQEYNLPEPLLESLGFSFRVNLFRKQDLTDSPTAKRTVEDEPNLGLDEPNLGLDEPNRKIAEKLSSAEQKILALIIENPATTNVQMAKNSGVSVSTVKRALNTLKNKNYIERQGGTRGRWLILKELDL